MGNKQYVQEFEKISYDKEENTLLNRASFDFISIIGRGGFGKVWKVSCRKYHNKIFAMKEMSKTKIIDKRSERSIKSERDILSRMNHPFIINMHFSFQDNDHLYLVMDYLQGGDLRYHISKERKFNEEQTKFFIACIILGLEYCHFNNIIHRDIKPENLVLDQNGYVKVTDFGIAKFQTTDNAKETSGTPGYMAPEVMVAQNHTIAVDFFAIGVIGYEFMKGVRPYLGRSRKEIKEKIMAKQASIKPNTIAEGWSIESADCINKLLQRKPVKRLGYQGACEVKEHVWFKNFPWKDLYNMKLVSPFVPKNTENFDHKYCNAVEKIGLDTEEKYRNIINNPHYKTVFDDYHYFNRLSDKESENNDRYSFSNPHTVYEVEENNREKPRRPPRTLRHLSYHGVPVPVTLEPSVSSRDNPISSSNNAYCNATYLVHKRLYQKKNLSFDINANPSGNATAFTSQVSGSSNNTYNNNTYHNNSYNSSFK